MSNLDYLKGLSSFEGVYKTNSRNLEVRFEGGVSALYNVKKDDYSFVDTDMVWSITNWGTFYPKEKGNQSYFRCDMRPGMRHLREGRKIAYLHEVVTCIKEGKESVIGEEDIHHISKNIKDNRYSNLLRIDKETHRNIHKLDHFKGPYYFYCRMMKKGINFGTVHVDAFMRGGVMYVVYMLGKRNLRVYEVSEKGGFDGLEGIECEYIYTDLNVETKNFIEEVGLDKVLSATMVESVRLDEEVFVKNRRNRSGIAA